MVWDELDLSDHAESADPSDRESTAPFPSTSVASSQRARSGTVFLSNAVLAGTKLLTVPQTLPPELFTLVV